MQVDISQLWHRAYISSENCKLVARVGMWFCFERSWQTLCTRFPVYVFLTWGMDTSSVCPHKLLDWMHHRFSGVSSDVSTRLERFVKKRQICWVVRDFSSFCFRWRQIQSLCLVDAYYYPLRTFEEKFDFCEFFLLFIVVFAHNSNWRVAVDVT